MVLTKSFGFTPSIMHFLLPPGTHQMSFANFCSIFY
jgi:hypothetical protein